MRWDKRYRVQGAFALEAHLLDGRREVEDGRADRVPFGSERLVREGVLDTCVGVLDTRVGVSDTYEGGLDTRVGVLDTRMERGRRLSH